MQIIKPLENWLELFSKRPIFSILVLATIGIILRVYFINWNLPPAAPDAFVFLIEGQSFANGDFSYFSTRFIWPIFLSFFFLIFHFEDNLGYFNLMRIVSILVSIASMPVIYYIAKQYVAKKYAIFACAILVIEPNMIENSLFTITEPIFILLGLLSFYFLIQKNSNLIPLSFLFAGLSFDTRLNGIVLILLVLIFCLVMIRTKKFSIKTFGIGLGVLILVIMPHIYLPIEQGNIPFLFHVTGTSQIIAEGKVLSSTFSESGSSDSFTILKNSVSREMIHLLRISLPYMIFFIPFGIIMSLKSFDLDKKILFSVIIISIIIALPQYSISAEYRNLLFLIPFFGIISVVGVQRVLLNSSTKNLILIILFLGLILVSVYFLKFQLEDDQLLVYEKEKFGKFVVENFSGRVLGGPYNEISHNVVNAKLGTIEEGNIYNDKIAVFVTYEPINSIQKLTNVTSSLGINYLVIDDIKNNRYPIFLDIFYHEKDFPFLEKVFDSQSEGYMRYHVKIFKVSSVD